MSLEDQERSASLNQATGGRGVGGEMNQLEEFIQNNWNGLMQKLGSVDAKVKDQLANRLDPVVADLGNYFVRGDKVGVEDCITDLFDQREIECVLETFSDFLRPGFDGWDEPAAEQNEQPTPIVQDPNSLNVQQPVSPEEPETSKPKSV